MWSRILSRDFLVLLTTPCQFSLAPSTCQKRFDRSYQEFKSYRMKGLLITRHGSRSRQTNRQIFNLDRTNSPRRCRLIKVWTSRQASFLSRGTFPRFNKTLSPIRDSSNFPPLHNEVSRLRKEGLTPDLGIVATNIVPAEPPSKLILISADPFLYPRSSLQALVPHSSSINIASISARIQIQSVATRYLHTNIYLDRQTPWPHHRSSELPSPIFSRSSIPYSSRA
jgi:hypothetical protein